MEIILNDLPFEYKLENEYAIVALAESLVSLLIELKKKKMKVVYKEDNIRGVELYPGYYMPKLFSSKQIRRDASRVLVSVFGRMKKIDVSEMNSFDFHGNHSKICSYAVANNLLVISFRTNYIFNDTILSGRYFENGEEVEVKNLSELQHAIEYWRELKIRKYDASPKHKINFGWGSEMDLCDDLAQSVLDDAEIYDKDDKRLVNYHEGNYYVFMRHIANCYHGFKNNAIPENIKSKLKDRLPQ